MYEKHLHLDLTEVYPVKKKIQVGAIYAFKFYQ